LIAHPAQPQMSSRDANCGDVALKPFSKYEMTPRIICAGADGGLYAPSRVSSWLAA
jgi:hypothetical protein